MTDTNALATMPAPQPTIDDREQYSLLMTQAKHAIDSGLLPAGIKTPQQALVILRKGRELGVPDMYALSNIAVVNGKPTAMAELMLALVYRAYGGNSIRVIETSSERAVVRYQRPEWDEPSTLEFTIGEAETAGLLKKGGPWMQYPAAMLRWRAVSAAAKLGFPEILAGLYTPEELGAPVVVEPSGEAWIDANAAEPEGRVVDPETGEILLADTQEGPQQPSQTSRPATGNQIAVIQKLSRLLGAPEQPDPDTTSAQASDRITELSRIYNERKGPARATVQPTARPDADTRAPTTIAKGLAVEIAKKGGVSDTAILKAASEQAGLEWVGKAHFTDELAAPIIPILESQLKIRENSGDVAEQAADQQYF